MPRTIGAALLLTTLLLAATATAVQEEVDRIDLCGLADAVVIAEVTSFEILWAEGDAGGILTRVWFALDMSLRGDAPETVTLVLAGGDIGDVRHEVEDQPLRPKLDRRYLLFLKQLPNGEFKIIGGEGGAVAIAEPGRQDGERYIEALASVGGCHAR